MSVRSRTNMLVILSLILAAIVLTPSIGLSFSSVARASVANNSRIDAAPALAQFTCSGIRFFRSAGVGTIFTEGDTHQGGTFTFIENNNFMEVREPVPGVIVGMFEQPRRLGDEATIRFAFDRQIKIVSILWYDNDPEVGEAGWSVNGISGPLTGHQGTAVTTHNLVTNVINISAGEDSGGIDFCFEEVEDRNGKAQGCTPGYWKQPQHFDSWVPTGLSPNQTLESVFDVPNSLGLDNQTLLQALKFRGGPGVEGAARILLRQAVAAVLNASHPDVNFSRSPGGVVTAVNTALASGNRSTILSLAKQLDRDNNAGCPLN